MNGEMQRRMAVVVEGIDDVRPAKVLVQGPLQQRDAMVEDEPMEDVVAVPTGRRIRDRRTKLADQQLREKGEGDGGERGWRGRGWRRRSEWRRGWRWG